MILDLSLSSHNRHTSKFFQFYPSKNTIMAQGQWMFGPPLLLQLHRKHFPLSAQPHELPCSKMSRSFPLCPPLPLVTLPENFLLPLFTQMALSYILCIRIFRTLSFNSEFSPYIELSWLSINHGFTCHSISCIFFRGFITISKFSNFFLFACLLSIFLPW